MTDHDDGGPAFPVPNDANVNGQEGLTKREYAAIALRVPDSGLDDWLNAMILKSRRLDLAGQAMQGYLASTYCPKGARAMAKDAPPGFPFQPLMWDKHDVIRFRANPIVRYLLDAGPFDMNDLGLMPFDNDAREQFAQLIGYSVSGFGELSYVDGITLACVETQGDIMREERSKSDE